jgi:hypothetical protein
MMYRFAGICLVLAACGAVQPLGDGGVVTTPQRLTVTVMGGGTVASAPAGIDCGARCSAEFDPNSMVTLTATPEADSAFAGWSGDCAGTSACTVTMDGAKNATATFAVHGAKRWVAQVSFSGQDTIEKIVVAPDGNAIGAGTVTDANGTDLFVIKYASSDGSVMWTNKIDVANGFPNLGGLATDADGNVYIAARLQGDGSTPIMIGTTPVVGDIFGNIIALRLAGADGAVSWVKQWGGNGQDVPEALAVSGTDLYVVGQSSSNPSNFDSKSFLGSTSDGFIVRASTADGTAAELKHFDGNIGTFGVAVNDTHVAVVGRVTSAVAIDRCNLQPSGVGDDAFVIDLLGSTLVCQWAHNFGDFVNNNNAAFQSVAAFPGGGWTVIGDFKGSILLAGSGASLTSRGDFDVVAGRFAGDGSHVWSFRYGDTGFDLGYGVSVTPDGAVILAGTFNTSITFGLVTVNGVMNAFVTRMSPGTTPVHEWAIGLGGDNYDLVEGIATAPDGSIYVASIFNGMTNIAGTLLTSQDQDSWIAALVR